MMDLEEYSVLMWTVLAAELLEEGLSTQESVWNGLVVLAKVLHKVFGRL